MTAIGDRAAAVSVIVPCRNEERYIARCLDSILAGDYPRDALEVLVVDGRSDDRTRAIVADYAARFPIVRLLDNPRRVAPAAVNIGIGAARGEILVRMDAHAVYPPNYLRDLVAALEHWQADNVGGTVVTLPGAPTAVARAIAVAMAHPFGVGNARFRIGARQPRWVETVAFFCCRRETFERVGWFDEGLADEDSEFNARLVRQGGRVLLLPDVACHYYARESLRQAARMYYRYGSSKPPAAVRLGRVMTIRQLVPPAFVLTLATAAALSPWIGMAGVAFGGAAAAYILAVAGAALTAGRTMNLKTRAALALVFPVMHVSYGIGFLRAVGALALAARRRSRPAGEPLAP